MQKNITIRQSNDLINAKYELNIFQKRLFLRLISKIEKNKNIYKIELKELAELCGVNYGQIYKYFRKSAEDLNNKSIVIYPNEKEDMRVKTNLFKEVISKESKHYIKIEVSDYLIPFLIDLKGNYTEYKLIYTLSLRSNYSIRLYEILKSNLFKKYFEITVDELKDIFCLEEEYALYGNFKRKIIEKSIKEINRFTDLKVSYAEKKIGKKVNSLWFSLESQIPPENLLPLEPNIKVNASLVELYEYVDQKNSEKLEETYSIEYLKAQVDYAKRWHKKDKGTLGGFILKCCKDDGAGVNRKQIKDNKVDTAKRLKAIKEIEQLGDEFPARKDLIQSLNKTESFRKLKQTEKEKIIHERLIEKYMQSL